jgi:hypothetical protein
LDAVPGFSIFVEEAGGGEVFGAGLGATARAEQEAGAVGDFFDGEDEPGVFRDDVADEEVDFSGEVRDGAAASDAAGGVDVVEVADLGGSGFDLHAKELVALGPAAADEDEVEALAVAVRFSDSEAEASGFVEEG